MLKTALVFGGGAAKGAYEAGVISYLRDELGPELGKQVPLHILTGTSIGAINACYLAGSAAIPEAQGRGLVDRWKDLRIEHILQFGTRDVARLIRDLTRRVPIRQGARYSGGLVNPDGLQEVVRRVIPWPEIGRNIRNGHLDALSVSCTEVASGRTTVFVHRRKRHVPPWSRDYHYRAISTRIGPSHALASAAIPLLFPAVPVGGQLYVDGGLRQSVPLSPALRLGAERVIVVSLRSRPVTATLLPGGEDAPGREALPEWDANSGGTEALRALGAPEEEAYPSAAFLLGKTLNALLLDRLDEDLHRLRRFNAFLEAGTRAYGPGFEDVFNESLKDFHPRGIRWVRNLLVHPSRDLGALAAEYARSPEFAKRADNLVGRLVRRLADSEARNRADLVSYLLFDGGYAEILVDLGRADARRRRDEWIRFFSDEPESEAEAVQIEARRRAQA